MHHSVAWGGGKKLIRIKIRIYARRACVHILIQKCSCGFQNIWKTDVSKFKKSLARAQADLGFLEALEMATKVMTCGWQKRDV